MANPDNFKDWWQSSLAYWLMFGLVMLVLWLLGVDPSSLK